jgi:hypothetical protein
VGVQISHLARDLCQLAYLAVTAREKFIVSYYTGRRYYSNTNDFVADVAERIVGRI